MDKFKSGLFKAIYINIIKPKSRLRIGQNKQLVIEIDTTFNKLQKKMWKVFFNIDIEDVEE